MPRLGNELDPDIERAVYALISERIETDSPDVREIRMGLLADFKKKNKSLGYGHVTTKVVRYNTLPDFLQIAGINVAEMYKLVGVDICWGNPLAAKFCRNCSSLSQETLTKVKKLIFDISPPYWHSTDVRSMVPKDRVYLILQKRYSVAERRVVASDISPAVANFWVDRKKGTNIPYCEYPAIANKFDLSLHWLLGLDAPKFNQSSLVPLPGAKHPCTILCDTVEQETILNAFLFLSDELRESLSATLEELIEMGVKP